MILLEQKSLANQHQWQTESNQYQQSQPQHPYSHNQQHPHYQTQLQQQQQSQNASLDTGDGEVPRRSLYAVDNRRRTSRLPVEQLAGSGHSAAVTSTNRIVGSIYIETPPAHVRESVQKQQQQKQYNIQTTSLEETESSRGTTQQSSTETNEDLLLVGAAPAIPEFSQSHHNFSAFSNKTNHGESVDTATTTMTPLKLICQRSSTASLGASSAQSSPKVTPKSSDFKAMAPLLRNLPMVSISGPSPPEEKPPLQPPTSTDCL